MSQIVLITIADMLNAIYRRGMDPDQSEAIMDELRQFVCMTAPSGSGFDNGTQLLVAERKRLVFGTAYHHLDDSGYYTGWTEHKVVVTPRFGGFDLRVTGRNRNGIKDYIADVFTDWLDTRLDSRRMNAAYRGKYFNFVKLEWV